MPSSSMKRRVGYRRGVKTRRPVRHIISPFYLQWADKRVSFRCRRARPRCGRWARLRGQPLPYGNASEHWRFLGRPGQVVSLADGGADPRADRPRLDGGELAGVAGEARAFFLAQVDPHADPRARRAAPPVAACPTRPLSALRPGPPGAPRPPP